MLVVLICKNCIQIQDTFQTLLSNLKYEVLVISQNLEYMHQVKYQISRNS